MIAIVLLSIPVLASVLFFENHQALIRRLQRRARWASPYRRMCDLQTRHNGFHASVRATAIIWIAWAAFAVALYIYA